MSPIDVEIIRRKLAVIIENLKALEPILAMSPEEFLQELYKRKATERLLQELIEAAIDINRHIIVQQGHNPPDDYYPSFLEARRLGILSAGLAERLAPSAGLRNRLVHECDRIDSRIILEATKAAQEIYSQYVIEINRFLNLEQV
jgi:uncharacterized protein YutE (UPF0331/DUF86 family)